MVLIIMLMVFLVIIQWTLHDESDDNGENINDLRKKHNKHTNIDMNSTGIKYEEKN